MKKADAIRLLGGTPSDAARELGITVSAVSQWPDELTRQQEDRVLGHLHRTNRLHLLPRSSASEQHAG